MTEPCVAAPDFLIIGAMRAGTTALADCLGRHPDISMATLKETDFFIAEKNYSRGFDWYASLFPSGCSLRGEASPNYAKSDVFKGVPARIRAARADIRLVYIVRDPVERFWSHYRHSFLVHGGLAAPERILGEAEGAHILASSLYHHQISVFMEEFSADQIKVVDFDAFTSDPASTLAGVLRFLSASTAVDLSNAENSNSAEQLASTPGWALKLSQHSALAGLRAATPPSWRKAVKRGLAKTRGTARETPPVSSEARQRVRDAVAEDASRFRTLTGCPFENWSV